MMIGDMDREILMKQKPHSLWTQLSFPVVRYIGTSGTLLTHTETFTANHADQITCPAR